MTSAAQGIRRASARKAKAWPVLLVALRDNLAMRRRLSLQRVEGLFGAQFVSPASSHQRIVSGVPDFALPKCEPHIVPTECVCHHRAERLTAGDLVAPASTLKAVLGRMKRLAAEVDLVSLTQLLFGQRWQLNLLNVSDWLIGLLTSASGKRYQRNRNSSLHLNTLTANSPFSPYGVSEVLKAVVE